VPTDTEGGVIREGGVESDEAKRVKEVGKQTILKAPIKQVPEDIGGEGGR